MIVVLHKYPPISVSGDLTSVTDITANKKFQATVPIPGLQAEGQMISDCILSSDAAMATNMSEVSTMLIDTGLSDKQIHIHISSGQHLPLVDIQNLTLGS